MAVIGRFRRDQDRYFGRVTTLSLQAEVVIAPAGAGRWTVHAGAAQLGSATDIPDGGGRLLRVELDDPSFAAPIAAELVSVATDGDRPPPVAALDLVWTRPPVPQFVTHADLAGAMAALECRLRGEIATSRAGA